MPKSCDPHHISAGLELLGRGVSPREASRRLAQQGIAVSANTLRRHQAAAKQARDADAYAAALAAPPAPPPPAAEPWGLDALMMRRDELPDDVELALQVIADDLLRGGYDGGELIGDVEDDGDNVDAGELAALAARMPPNGRWPVYRLLRYMVELPTFPER